MCRPEGLFCSSFAALIPGHNPQGWIQSTTMLPWSLQFSTWAAGTAHFGKAVGHNMTRSHFLGFSARLCPLTSITQFNIQDFCRMERRWLRSHVAVAQLPVLLQVPWPRCVLMGWKGHFCIWETNRDQGCPGCPSLPEGCINPASFPRLRLRIHLRLGSASSFWGLLLDSHIFNSFWLQFFLGSPALCWPLAVLINITGSDTSCVFYSCMITK